jgi:hypothetical protein
MPKKETIQVHLATANPNLSPATRFGKAYLRQVSRGRPLGTGTYRNAEEFRKAASDAVRTVRKRDDEVTPQAVVELLTESGVGQFQRWLNHFNVPWESLLDS